MKIKNVKVFSAKLLTNKDDFAEDIEKVENRVKYFVEKCEDNQNISEVEVSTTMISQDGQGISSKGFYPRVLLFYTVSYTEEVVRPGEEKDNGVL